MFFHPVQGHAEALRDGADTFAAPRLIGLQTFVFCLAAGVELEGFHPVDGQQQGALAVGVDHPALEGRVEGDKFVDVHFRQFRRFLRGHRPIQGDLHEVGLVRDGLQTDAEAFRIANDVAHGHQLGHVITRLVGQAQTGIGLAVASSEGTGDTTLATVVGGQGQFPVAEHAMQGLQIVEGCVGSLQHVAAPAG